MVHIAKENIFKLKCFFNILKKYISIKDLVNIMQVILQMIRPTMPSMIEISNCLR